MSGGSGKLNPIYAALDAHQYSRAIKLALPLPDTNVLGKALLAHAYTKAGQKYNSLVTLNKVLGGHYFELQYELDTCLESTVERQNAAAADNISKPMEASTASVATAPTKSSSTSKKGKKGKKKPAPTSKQPPAGPPLPQESQAQQQSASVTVGQDLIDQLNTPPILPENFEVLAPRDDAITDETILATLVVSLQVHKLSFTVFQMYASAASVQPTELNLRKTFTSGLAVLASPSKWKPLDKLEAYVLSHMQAVALQWARLSASTTAISQFPLMLATSWAAQSSLWQLEWLPEDDKRSMILPRLAESMAQRLVKQEEEVYQQQLSSGQNSNNHVRPFRGSAEIQLLSFRTLQVQSKWDEMLESIRQKPSHDDDHPDEETNKKDDIDSTAIISDFGVSLSHRQVLMERASILKRLCRWSDAKAIFESLLNESPDDWSCWKGHLECSILEERMKDTERLMESTLALHSDRPFQLRGPHLMKVEIASQRIRQNASSAAIEQLSSSIVDYAKVFARRANCAFSDVEMYLDRLIRSDEEEARTAVVSLLEFTSSLRTENTSITSTGSVGTSVDNKERRYRLRAYTFSVKVIQKLVSVYSDLLGQYLPDWKEIVSEWKATESLPISDEVEEVRLRSTEVKTEVTFLSYRSYMTLPHNIILFHVE
jgi:tetratricopeptide (TPR) repeat protein